MLSRIIFGARLSMIVGLSVATIATILCTLIGEYPVPGWQSRHRDTKVRRYHHVLSGPGHHSDGHRGSRPRINTVIAVLGIMGGIGGRTRVVRSAVIGIRENVYFDAARAIGAPNGNIFFRHVLPNIMGPVIILFTIEVGGAILMEATLSFLGFGIPPPFPSWGGYDE